MDAERSENTILQALVLTWNGTTTRILCPYRCTRKIHSHGTTMPHEGAINSRAAHCLHDSDGRSRECNHHLNDTKTKRKERDRFLAWCVTEKEELARAMINSSSNRANLLQERDASDGKTALHMACEEGHIKIVNLLLEHGSLLEEQDSEGNTPLLSAINYGRGDVAHRLIEAGATTAVANKNGKNFIDQVRELLKLQEMKWKFNQRIIDTPLTLPPRVYHSRRSHAVKYSTRKLYALWSML